jgi:hypothetical protein
MHRFGPTTRTRLAVLDRIDDDLEQLGLTLEEGLALLAAAGDGGFVPFAIHSPLLLTAGPFTVAPLFPSPHADRPLKSSAANIAVVLQEAPKSFAE